MSAPLIVAFFLAAFALSARAEGGYTNHAGNVIAGWPVALTRTQVTLAPGAGRLVPGAAEPIANHQSPSTNHQAPSSNHQAPGTTYPLSIFPESEQRRIAADFGEPRLPVEVKRAIDGAEKAMARSRKRAEKGLCTKEESEAFCAKSSAALRTYLDKQVESGAITPAERKAIGR